MANYYADVFPDGEVLDIVKMPMPDGNEAVITSMVRANGTDILMVNGGPSNNTEFTEAFSLTINCEDQKEVDHFWSRFVGDGGSEVACGWCRDQFGVFWQVIPVELPQLLSNPDPEKAAKAFAAMQEMIKIDIETLKQAVEG